MYKEKIKDNITLLVLYRLLEYMIKIAEEKFNKEEVKEVLLEQIKQMLKEI